MNEINMFQRLFIKAIEKWKQFRCPGHRIVTLFSAETFTVDKWERCSGVGICRNCGLDFTVIIPADDSERQTEDYLGY